MEVARHTHSFIPFVVSGLVPGGERAAVCASFRTTCSKSKMFDGHGHACSETVLAASRNCWLASFPLLTHTKATKLNILASLF